MVAGVGPSRSRLARPDLVPWPQLSRRSAAVIRDPLFHDKPKPPDEHLMLELRRCFKPEVVALSEHLDRDLIILWG
jgi:hypothetical protein